MPRNLADLKVCIFDVFGTVVDWRGSLIEDLPKLGKKHGIETDWTSFADDWRGLYQPQMARVRKGQLPCTQCRVVDVRWDIRSRQDPKEGSFAALTSPDTFWYSREYLVERLAQ